MYASISKLAAHFLVSELCPLDHISEEPLACIAIFNGEFDDIESWFE